MSLRLRRSRLWICSSRISRKGLVCAARAVWFACVCAGIRALPSRFKRRPCAGRHLLFFAAAKKSRQKKAAHTANSSSCLRAPKRSHASHGNHVTHVRCQRSCGAPHPLHAPALHQAVPDIPRPPRRQTVCRLSRHTRTTPDGVARLVFLVRALTCAVRQPTHSLPPARRKPFAAASPCAGV
ncbi:hypothetical protein SAMN05445504_1841 [Burkholderia sp. CF099]|nr:hypothetical protein SAMN05445504_1841 [Burkholderia sp. CF099]